MGNFIVEAILWTLALYGLFEIVKTLIDIYTYRNVKSDGIYLIVAVKNQENKIEGFIRSLLFRILYGNDELIKEIIVTDLESKDKTMEILDKLQKDYDTVQVSDWKEAKNKLDIISNKEKI